MKVSFWSYKGGTGRTLSLANVSVELARRGRRVGVVDLDLEAPGLYILFDLNKEEIQKSGHLGDILEGKMTGLLGSIVMELNRLDKFSSLEGQLFFLPTINTPLLDNIKFNDEMFIFVSQIFDEFIKIFRLDYLLIDTRTGFSILAALGSAFSDLTIVCFRPDKQDTFGVKEALKSYKFNRTSYTFVCSPVPDLPQSKIKLREAERLFNEKINIVVGFEPSLLLEEKLLICEEPENPISEAYRKIADYIEEIK